MAAGGGKNRGGVAGGGVVHQELELTELWQEITGQTGKCKQVVSATPAAPAVKAQTSVGLRECIRTDLEPKIIPTLSQHCFAIKNLLQSN